MSDAGICTNPQCPRQASGDRIERYPGPGEYCPDCGERLQACPVPESAPAPHREPRSPALRALILGCSAALAVAAIASLVVVAQPAIGALRIRVCTTPMTDRIGDEIVRAYVSRHSEWPYHFDVTRPGDAACDVRFRAALPGPAEAVIARDGVVAIVNPQNDVSHLSGAQLRDVLAGRIVDWSQLGGQRGPIAVTVPDGGSDAAMFLAQRIMQGQPFGARVARTLDTPEMVRSIASPDGIRSLGIAPFSAAGPAKVLSFDNAPPPAPSSIASERYPLAVRIIADSDFRHPSSRAAGLIAFARSADAHGLVTRMALIGLRQGTRAPACPAGGTFWVDERGAKASSNRPGRANDTSRAKMKLTLMNDPSQVGRGLAIGPGRATHTEAALDALAEYEKVAAERRALAEELLAQARDLEAQLSGVRQTLDPLAAAAATALASEREAEERARLAQERFGQAKAQLDAERRSLAAARAARHRAEADVAEVSAHVDALSKTNGLTAEAAQRIVERRIADTLRRTTNGAS